MGLEMERESQQGCLKQQERQFVVASKRMPIQRALYSNSLAAAPEPPDAKSHCLVRQPSSSHRRSELAASWQKAEQRSISPAESAFEAACFKRKTSLFQQRRKFTSNLSALAEYYC
jgi:hypothetical protein